MDISKIIADFGNYYENNGQNMARIVKQVRAKSSIDNEATIVETNDTVWKAAEARMTRVIQPFQKVWTPINSPLSFEPVEIRQYNLKIDVEEYPDDVKDTWLAFLEGEGINRAEWPFIRWYIEEHLLPQAQEDLELKEKYKGVYAAPTSGTAGAASTAMNGLKKIINDHISTGRIVPAPTGALDTDIVGFVEQLEDWVDAMNPLITSNPMTLKMNPQLYRRFLRGMNKKYNTNYNQTDVAKLWEYPINVKPELALASSSKIFMTTKQNFISLRRKMNNQSKVQVEGVDRKVKLFTDFSMGLGFVIPELVMTNDLDLV